MLAIEKKRRRILGAALQGCRLFIPIVIRGRFTDLPAEITENCQYLDCNKQSTLVNFNIGDDPVLKGRLFDIVEYIKDLCDKMESLKNELFRDCDKFVFRRTVSGSISPMPSKILPFPGR